MGTSLTGKNISASYLGLLKTTDNAVIGGTAKTITDGNGNDLPIKLSTAQFLVSSGSAGVPSIGFSSDTDTGLFYSTNVIGLAIGGSEKYRFETNSFVAPDGSSTTPALAFTNDSDTGVFRNGSGVVGFSSNSTLSGEVTLTGFRARKNSTASAPNYTFIGDDNTGLHSLDADRLDFILGGNRAFGMTYTTGVSTLQTFTTDELVFSVGGNEQVRITDSGNVGINNSLPTTAKLVVDGEANSYVARLNGNTTTGQSYGLRVRAGTNTSDNSLLIENTSATSLLNVRGDGRFTLSSYGSGSFTGTATQRLGVDSSGNVIEIPIGSGAVDGAGATGQASFWVDSDTISGDNDFYWDNTNKRLGIGTNSPTHLLTLNETDTASVQLVIDNENTTDAGTETSTIRFRHYRSYVAGLNDAGEITVGKEEAWDESGDRNSYMSFGTRTGSTGVTEKMRLDSGGRLLVNSTTNVDATPLQVTAPSGFTVVSGFISPEATSSIQFKASGTTANYKVRVGAVADDLLLFSGGNETARLDSSGDLAIGVTSSSARLTVKDSSDSGFDSGIAIIRSANTQTGYINMVGGAMNFNSPSIPITFRQSGSEIIRIDSSGNLGLGVSSPNRELEVSGNGTAGTQIQVTGTQDSAGIKFVPVSGNQFEVQASTSSEWFVYDRTNNAYRLRINSSGDVGINDIVSGNFTTNYDTKLLVGGEIIARSLTSNESMISIGGDSTSAFIKSGKQDGSLTDRALRFVTGEDERMRISSDGDVLLRGTYNPYTTSNRGNITLNGTAGNILAFTNGSAERAYIYSDLTNLTIRNVISGDLIFDTNSTERMRIESNGKIDISGYGTEGAYLSSKGSFRIDIDNDNDHTDRSFIISSNNATSDLVTVKETGFVGIGTTSPAKQFTVDSGTASDIAQFGNNNGSLVVGYTTNLASIDLSATTEKFRIRQGSSVPLTIDDSQNVGIGTTSPLNKLHVSTSDDVTALFQSTDSISKIEFADNNTTGSTRPSIGASGNNTIFTQGSTERLRITSGGNVAINNSVGKGRLSVHGSLTVGSTKDDPDITVTETGDDVSVTANRGGSIYVNVPLEGTTTQNCTVTFTYEATSWKSWHLEYMFASTDGMTQGAIGGYNNGNTGNDNFKSVEGIAVTVAHSIGGTGNQHNIITFTFTGSSGMGIHPMCSFKYTQGGGDGMPRADRVTVAYVDGS